MARYALVIGIAEYQSKHLANLSKPVQDADAIATLLQEYGQCDTEPTVLKGKVTTQQLVEALQTFLTKQAINSEAIIYFTGHGISVKEPLGPSQGYLTTSDCEVSLGSDRKPIGHQNAISFGSLNSLIQGTNLSSLVMLIDACHSGDFIEQAAVEQSFSAFGAKQDHLLITACRDFESAFAKKSDAHSLFTGAVLDALVPAKADAEGIITGDSLFASLSRTLKGSRQEPVRFGKGRSLRIVQFPAELLPEPTPLAEDRAVRQLRVPRVPLQMPPLPDHFVERPEYQQAVKEQLLFEGTKVGTLVVSAIYGLGGIGKSVLASKLAHDDEIQARFCDGILWATLGQNPDILPLLSDWIQALGDYDYKPTSTEGASNQLRTLLYDKQVLLVVDDVWNPEHLAPFQVGGESCCVLVTTREAKIQSAHRYDLDVMDADQALELMTQKLSGVLNEMNRQRALAFSERVGYLPLALELAASQIEEGVTWSELLEDLQDEVSRLETLDTYGPEEIPDDARRRKYSLLACFNLSLKQLSSDQLQQFAWLGVMPEDASLTQEMAETLWQVTSRQARAILRAFRAKTLVLQGAQQVDEQPSYRMHDLMHDLAGRLLISPLQPIREGELPGLGLTKAEAHSELLNRYGAKTHNGQWYTLKDDGYIYAHLTWHMEQAKQPQAIHQLLRTSNEHGHNGWYQACDAIGKPASFVNDLGRGWQLTIVHYENNPSESVALLFRYALIRTSLNSLVSNVPAELVGAFVEKGVWQVAQGLAYAKQTQNPWQRAECISAIMPYMPKALVPEALKVIRQIDDAAYRSYVLSKLAERFSEFWPEALETIPKIQDRYGQHRKITKGFSYRAMALSQLAKKLPLQYLSEAIDIAYQIQDISDQAIALNELAQRQSELLPKALEITRQIKDDFSRSLALSILASYLPELLPEALQVTRQIKNEWSRTTALCKLVEYLPSELLSEALKVTCQIKNERHRSIALCKLVEHLPPELLSEALKVTRQIQEMYPRSLVLNVLAGKLSSDLWSEALEIMYQIPIDPDRSHALSALVMHLPSERWQEALEVTHQIPYKHYRSYALISLAVRQPELWSEALEVTRQIEPKGVRWFSLIDLAEKLPSELLPETLEITRQIQDESVRALALSKLAVNLPKLWSETLEVTCQIQNEFSRSNVLREQVAYLPSKLWPEALKVIRLIQKESCRSTVLIALAEYLPELWPEVLKVIRKIEDEFSRATTLREIAVHLPSEFRSEVLEMIRQIQNESSRSLALRELIAHLSLEFRSEVLEMIRQIQDESSRSLALSALAVNLPELWPEVLAVTKQIQYEPFRSRALRELVVNLPSELWPKALEMIHQIQDEFCRSNALYELAVHLPELWPETLEVIRQIQDEQSRTHLLHELVVNLPSELWPEVLEMIRQIRSESSRSSILSKIAVYLPEALWPEVLEMTRQIQDESCRSDALRELAKHLSAELRSEMFDMMWAINDKYYCANALQGFLPYLDKLSMSSFIGWARIFDILAYQNREQLLQALPATRPIILKLGNEQAFSGTLQAVRDVCQQWP